jgi:hypothetical protein
MTLSYWAKENAISKNTEAVLVASMEGVIEVN